MEQGREDWKAQCEGVLCVSLVVLGFVSERERSEGEGLFFPLRVTAKMRRIVGRVRGQYGPSDGWFSHYDWYGRFRWSLSATVHILLMVDPGPQAVSAAHHENDSARIMLSGLHWPNKKKIGGSSWPSQIKSCSSIRSHDFNHSSYIKIIQNYRFFSFLLAIVCIKKNEKEVKTKVVIQ